MCSNRKVLKRSLASRQQANRSSQKIGADGIRTHDLEDQNLVVPSAFVMRCFQKSSVGSFHSSVRTRTAWPVGHGLNKDPQRSTRVWCDMRFSNVVTTAFDLCGFGVRFQIWYFRSQIIVETNHDKGFCETSFALPDWATKWLLTSAGFEPATQRENVVPLAFVDWLHWWIHTW